MENWARLVVVGFSRVTVIHESKSERVYHLSQIPSLSPNEVSWE